MCGTGMVILLPFWPIFFDMENGWFNRKVGIDYWDRQYIDSTRSTYMTLSELMADYRDGKDLVITKYPDRILDSISVEMNRRKEFFYNLSIGASYIEYRTE